MADVSTKYLGLELKNPIIAGSSGLTTSPDRIQELEEKGAAAVVLRSIYEEEIAFEFDEALKEAAPGSYGAEYLEYFDYFDYQVREKHLDEYIAQTDKEDIRVVYENLTKGSRNHLRSFVSTLNKQTGETYSPQYLDQATFDTIAGSETERGRDN